MSQHLAAGDKTTLFSHVHTRFSPPMLDRALNRRMNYSSATRNHRHTSVSRPNLPIGRSHAAAADKLSRFYSSDAYEVILLAATRLPGREKKYGIHKRFVQYRKNVKVEIERLATPSRQLRYLNRIHLEEQGRYRFYI